MKFLTNLFISDGKIESYKLYKQTLVLYFIDYEQTRYVLKFDKCNEILEKGSVGFSLSHAKLGKSEGVYFWKVFDDEGLVLKVKFQGAEVEEKRESDLQNNEELMTKKGLTKQFLTGLNEWLSDND